MTDIWIARDATDDGSLGDVTMYQGKPRWFPELQVFHGSALAVLSEYRRQKWPIANGQMVRLSVDMASLVDVTSVLTDASSEIGTCVPVATC